MAGKVVVAMDNKAAAMAANRVATVKADTVSTREMYTRTVSDARRTGGYQGGGGGGY